MRKLKISWLFAFFLLWTVFSVTVSAGTLDVNQRGTLTMHYTKDGIDFGEIEVDAYRVADMDSSGSFQMRAPYSSYPVDIYGVKTQQQWKNIATTLVGYIQADDIPPNTLLVTNENGIAHMNHMKPGLYLVPGTIVEMDGVMYTFEDYWVYMPMRNPDGTWNYDAEVNPKCSKYILPEEYSVKVLWDDEGYESLRPEFVTVEIYRGDELYVAVELSDENEWFYEWEVEAQQEVSTFARRAVQLDEDSWSVVQKDISERYTVSVNQNGNHFTIINTYKKSEPEKPDSPDDKDDETEEEEIVKDSDSDSATESKEASFGAQSLKTGDAANAELYMILLAIAGIGLLILGIYRSRKNEKTKD